LRPLFRDPDTRAGLTAALRGLGPVLRARRPVPGRVERCLRLLDG
jgi:hypothetical protein